jgi:hypothetical protein
MTDLTTTLTGTAAIPSGTVVVPAQTLTVTITIPQQTIAIGAISAPASVTLDETTLAAALKPLLMSQSGTVVTTTTGGIVDSQGNIWTLVPSASSGQQIAVNGVVDTTTANVVTLAYIAPTAGAALNIYQVNNAGNCYMKTSATAAWVQTTFPAVTT